MSYSSPPSPSRAPLRTELFTPRCWRRSSPSGRKAPHPDAAAQPECSTPAKASRDCAVRPHPAFPSLPGFHSTSASLLPPLPSRLPSVTPHDANALSPRTIASNSSSSLS
ncbi:hypothetical protein TRVL_09950 [Trypanosoma vivax]|nr:hypothetical protein TRVL_09950 [Trypanosoma vivax]